MQRVTARDAHKPFHGLVIPVDHPWWNTHFPPNGYFCACTVRQLSEDAVKRRGLKVTQNPPMETRTWTDRRSGRTAQVPRGVTPGFDVNPGAEFLAAEANHDRIAEGLDPLARGVERGFVQEARLRGLRTGNEHLGAIDLDAPLPGTDGGKGDAFDWVEGEPGRVRFSQAIDEAAADGNRRIGIVHNHPRSSSLSPDDIAVLGTNPGAVRVVAVGHDGSLYLAAMPRLPRSGIVDAAKDARKKANELLKAEAQRVKMDEWALRDLASHVATAALDRRGYIRYAHAFTGGSRVNVARFGERRLNAIIAELVEWMAGQNL